VCGLRFPRAPAPVVFDPAVHRAACG
jgi:hypothetical protein